MGLVAQLIVIAMGVMSMVSLLILAVRTIIRGLVSDRFHGTCEDFLRKDLGEAAVPALEEAARKHPMASVRTRAAALLRQRGRDATEGSR
ncbi:hypothetical protein [Corallococcus exercitus]|uniref:hypothetical protein n=1 Tax=Corallococcus exercitus TaxID=2316736 RepID=UPI0035D402F6